MAEPLRNVASDIRGLLEAESPRSYCDACLAFAFDVTLDEARAMALMLARGPGVSRQHRKCDNCGRRLETTARTFEPRSSS